MREENSTEVGRSRMAHVTPILRVEDIEKSLTYYTGPLGFKMDWRVGGFLSVSRERCSFMLCEQGQGRPGTWLWIAVEDADQLYAEWMASGAMIRQKPTNFPWGSREMQVTDPDGHVLRFASEATDEPFGSLCKGMMSRDATGPDQSLGLLRNALS